MKKFLVLAISFLAMITPSVADIALSEDNFPDPALRSIISEYDEERDGVLTDQEISRISRLSIYTAVTTLKGVESLTSLETLQIQVYQHGLLNPNYFPSTLANLSIIDGSAEEIEIKDGLASVSVLTLQDTALKKFVCNNATSLKTIGTDYNPNLEEINVSGCNNLEKLPDNWFGWNSKIKRINISNSGIRQLNICVWEQGYSSGATTVTAIEANNCPQLTSVTYDGGYTNITPLETASFRNCPNLRDLRLSNCALTNFDIEGSTAIERLNLKGNQISGVLNLSDLPKLHWLNISDADIYLNSSNKNSPFIMESFVLGNVPIDTLYCQGNFSKMDKLDFSNSSTLKALYCGGYSSKTLKEINVNGCSSLQLLDCARGKLEIVRADNCTNLETIHAGHAKLNTLSLYRCESLKILDIEEHELTELDLTWCKNLEELLARNGKLKSLNLANYQKLSSLSAYDNALTHVDLSNCTSLLLAELYENPNLAEVKVNGCSALQNINIYGSFALEEFDASGLSNLQSLNVSSYINPLTEKKGMLKRLYLTGCSSLVTLYCQYNQLEQLDLSDVSDNMYTLDARYNCLAFIKGMDHLTYPMKRFTMYGNVHTVVGKDRKVNLLEMVPGFDVSKISNIEGGEIFNQNFLRFDEAVVTYTFDAGLDCNAAYPKEYNLPSNPTFTIQYIEDEYIPIDDEHFPDEMLRENYAKKYDLDNDGLLSPQERMISEVVVDYGVYSLKGMEHFPLMKKFVLYSNTMDTLDCKCFPLLKELRCSELSNLKYLYLSENKWLEDLYCYNCNIHSLDLSRNERFWNGQIWENPLLALNLSPASSYGDDGLGNFQATVSVDGNGRFDLSTIENLHIDRIGNITGGYLDGSYIVFDADELTYEYDTDGKGKVITVKLIKDTHSAVSNVQSDKRDSNATVYSLSGVRMSEKSHIKGYFIKDGKKFFNKQK